MLLFNLVQDLRKCQPKISNNIKGFLSLLFDMYSSIFLKLKIKKNNKKNFIVSRQLLLYHDFHADLVHSYVQYCTVQSVHKYCIYIGYIKGYICIYVYIALAGFLSSSTSLLFCLVPGSSQQRRWWW